MVLHEIGHGASSRGKLQFRQYRSEYAAGSWATACADGVSQTRLSMWMYYSKMLVSDHRVDGGTVDAQFRVKTCLCKNT